MKNEYLQIIAFGLEHEDEGMFLAILKTLKLLN